MIKYIYIHGGHKKYMVVIIKGHHNTWSMVAIVENSLRS